MVLGMVTGVFGMVTGAAEPPTMRRNLARSVALAFFHSRTSASKRVGGCMSPASMHAFRTLEIFPALSRAQVPGCDFLSRAVQ